MKRLPVKLLFLSLLPFWLAANDQTLIVGTTPDFPPLSFKNQKGKLCGIEIDLAHELAKALRKRLVIKSYPWSKLFQAVRKGEIDLAMAGISVTAQRQKDLSFTRPWLTISQMALTRPGTPIPNPSSGGEGLKTGFLRHTTGEALIGRLFPKSRATGFQSLSEALGALIYSRIDYLFLDAPTVWYYTSTHPLDHVIGWYLPYTRESYAWATAPKRQKLKKAVDRALDDMQKNGVVAAVVRHWIPVAPVGKNPNEPIRFNR